MIIIICGPTASGKTGVGISLAKRFNGEIVSADSQQVWRGFDVGTAKANLKARSEVPHHLIDVADPREVFDAKRFVELADRAIEDIAAMGKLPFVVGGTGMYLRMLEKGICDAPPRDAGLRGKMEEAISAGRLPELYEELVRVDPDAARDIHPNDKTRIVRALEIFRRSGRGAALLRREHGFSDRRYDALKIGLEVERGELYRRIDERVDRMVEEGLLDEVKGLLARYDRSCQPFAAVGYKEFVAHVEGEIDLPEAVRLVKQNSRHFAKRQLTWFRADREIVWFNPNDMAAMEAAISAFLSSGSRVDSPPSMG
jgi:tRNA dimethylallyltransferase